MTNRFISGANRTRTASTTCRAFLPIRIAAVLSGLFFSTVAAPAIQVDLVGPYGSGAFGTIVTMLPNGNFVVTDPDFSTDAAAKIGAVYLYDPTGSVISTLTGSSPGDQVGNGGVTVLKNGNYVVRSWAWSNPSPSNASSSFGAVTLGNAMTGAAGVVSAANSLIGETGAFAQGTYVITALQNGNYVVSSPYWNDGVNSGAVTFGDGVVGSVGEVSTSNSLYGTTNGNPIGYVVTPLSNGNYVVGSQTWSNGAAGHAGAATWCSGTTGRVGPVSSENSLVGDQSNDDVGGSIVALSNGNYVVLSDWRNASGFAVGAVTWGDGASGTTGIVDASNSLVGSTPGDQVGHGGTVVALSNGNYVVGSPYWNNGMGAATWGDGSVGVSGTISSSNSLVGQSTSDGVGGVIAALTNGNYVVGSPSFTNLLGNFAGAATWADGQHGTFGTVSTDNSLYGTHDSDNVGFVITPLMNGNYVVSSISWHNGTVRFAGAATWGNGSGGTIGPVSADNSLVGTQEYDEVGYAVTPLSNGNYVVDSSGWANGNIDSAGATTWGDGESGVVGTISSDNSVIGTSPADFLGSAIALPDGNYLIASSAWNKYTGVVAWANGTTGAIGIGPPVDSLTGRAVNDEIGYGGITPFSNGNLVVVSPSWANDMGVGVGAVTLIHGRPSGGTVNQLNSVVGQVKGEGWTMSYGYDTSRDRLIVGRPPENIVTIFDDDPVFRDGFE